MKKNTKNIKKTAQKIEKNDAKKHLKKTLKKNTRKLPENLKPILVLAIGIILGAALIGLGIYNNINSVYNDFEVRSEEDLKADIDNKNNELNQLLAERDSKPEDAVFTEEYESVTRKISTKENEIYELDAELYKVQSGFYRDLHMKQYLDSVPLILLGASTIVFSIGLSMKIQNKHKKNKILTVIEEK
jgi:hypothetical protein